MFVILQTVELKYECIILLFTVWNISLKKVFPKYIVLFKTIENIINQSVKYL